jgi:hypothetical protein
MSSLDTDSVKISKGKNKIMTERDRGRMRERGGKERKRVK